MHEHECLQSCGLQQSVPYETSAWSPVVAAPNSGIYPDTFVMVLSDLIIFYPVFLTSPGRFGVRK